MPKTSWKQKLAGAKAPHTVVLDKPFAGVPAGSTLFIASPALLAEAIRAIPRGTFANVQNLRADLAARHGAQATCPTSTAIFLRIVAEAALEDLAAGRPAADVTPFWRVVDPDGPVAAKLSCGRDFIATMRAMETPGPPR